MKKVKTLAIVLIVAMMLMGAGYAVWTDLVTIGGNVETGNMNVVIDHVTVGAQGVNQYIKVAEDKKSAEIELAELVPGGSTTFIFKFKNVGNIDAKVDTIEQDIKIEGELKDYLDISFDKIDNKLIESKNGTLKWNLTIDLDNGAPNSIQGKSASFTITPQFTQAFGQ